MSGGAVMTAAAGASFAVWLYLVFLRGGFWRARDRLEAEPGPRAALPEVVALVPARNEAEAIGRSLRSLLDQDYPGRLHVVLVDDASEDGTASVAHRAAAETARPGALHIYVAAPLPAGWTGKVWALAEGSRQAERLAPEAPYLWLSDADIGHDPGNLRRLVAKAEAERRDLVSLMVVLSSQGFWARLLIPPFVYFFQMLYPFGWVNDPACRTAAAAGGCVLLRRAALARAGGFAAIREALIDDCALARRIKEASRADAQSGGIWLGLTTAAHSLRPYRGLGEIWRMVARSAYTQLGHSPLLLAGALAGMALTFLAPPLAVAGAPWHGSGAALLLGGGAWALMAASARPILALYGQPAWHALLLPVAAALYCAMTLDSAVRHWRGRGGAWKGRIHPGAGAVARRPSGR